MKKRIENIIGAAALVLSVGIILYLIYYIVVAIATMGGILPAILYIMTIEVC